MIDPLVDRLRQVRAQLPAGAKIVLQGRSFGASLAAEIGHRYPELVDRLVLVSPSLPERASFDYSVERIRLFDNHSKTNFAWVAWCGELLDQMTWHRPERPFHHVPTYILGGELDNERTPREHELFAHWSTSTTNIKYVLFDKQGHDVTGVNGNNKSEKRRGAQAFASVLQFIGLR
jgi:pimeloyl-ACP methyl ester carboxylesterase